jgi:hypothetical protein
MRWGREDGSGGVQQVAAAALAAGLVLAVLPVAPGVADTVGRGIRGAVCEVAACAGADGSALVVAQDAAGPADLGIEPVGPDPDLVPGPERVEADPETLFDVADPVTIESDTSFERVFPGQSNASAAALTRYTGTTILTSLLKNKKLLRSLVAAGTVGSAIYGPALWNSDTLVPLDPSTAYCVAGAGCWSAATVTSSLGEAAAAAAESGGISAAAERFKSGWPGAGVSALISGGSKFAEEVLVPRTSWTYTPGTGAAGSPTGPRPLALSAVQDGTYDLRGPEGTLAFVTDWGAVAASGAQGFSVGALSSLITSPGRWQGAVASGLGAAYSTSKYALRNRYLVHTPRTGEERAALEAQAEQEQAAFDDIVRRVESWPTERLPSGATREEALALIRPAAEGFRDRYRVGDSWQFDEAYTAEEAASSLELIRLWTLRADQLRTAEQQQALLPGPGRVGLDPGEGETARIRDEYAALRAQDPDANLARVVEEAERAATTSDGPRPSRIRLLAEDPTTGTAIAQVVEGPQVIDPATGDTIVGPFAIVGDQVRALTPQHADFAFAQDAVLPPVGSDAGVPLEPGASWTTQETIDGEVYDMTVTIEQVPPAPVGVPATVTQATGWTYRIAEDVTLAPYRDLAELEPQFTYGWPLDTPPQYVLTESDPGAAYGDGWEFGTVAADLGDLTADVPGFARSAFPTGPGEALLPAANPLPLDAGALRSAADLGLNDVDLDLPVFDAESLVSPGWDAGSAFDFGSSSFDLDTDFDLGSSFDHGDAFGLGVTDLDLDGEG